MTHRLWLISALLTLLCGGVLVLFTGVEEQAARAWRCGPLGGQGTGATADPCR